jgi:hypothetical protein
LPRLSPDDGNSLEEQSLQRLILRQVFDCTNAPSRTLC